MLFRQFVDDDLGCASYLIGDPEVGEAAVVDPAYAIEPYLEAAQEHGLRIVRVLETHTHADHVSGHGRLALEHNVPISIHPAAEPAFPFDPLADGQVIRIGHVDVRVMHTPGHTPGSVVYGTDGWVLSGDLVFAGSIGRSDFPNSSPPDMERSLRRFLELPDPTEVYPGHGPRTTVARERERNPFLQGL